MFTKGSSSISLKELQSKVSEVDLVSFYLNTHRLPCIIKSPLRKDNNPSFGLYLNGDKIKWVDFATGEKGGIYDLLSRMWHCTFKETLTKIEKDISTQERKGISIFNHSLGPTTIRKEESDIKCKIREWRDYDIKYWESYGISLKWLKYAEIYPISHKIVIKGNKKYVFGTDKYAYAFIEHKEGKTTIKIYQPYNKKGYKWANKHDKSVISLWTKIPKEGKTLVICSSVKDALCFWANTNIPAIALQGEGYGVSETALKELKSRFTNIYILFDNDKAGLEDGKKLSENTGFANLVLPPFEGGKDVSDLMKLYGKEKFLTVINKLLPIN